MGAQGKTPTELGRNRATRDQALSVACEVECAWAASGNDVDYNRVVKGAKLFEAYLLGEVQTDGR